MSCCNGEIQVLDPQVLGVRGDPYFDEYGSYELDTGELDVTITFLYEKFSSDYRFEYLYIDDLGDSTPQDIRAVITAQTATNFTVKLSGSPVTATCVLRWHVQRNDPLQVNQPLTPGPVYGVIRSHQQGLTAIPSGQDYVQVTFSQPQPDNDWVFEACEIENLGDPIPVSQIFTWTVSLHETTGFRLELSGITETSNYKLRWKCA